MTLSQPSITRIASSGSVTSDSMNSKPSVELGAFRSVLTTSYPFAKRSLTITWPIFPEPPVTSTLVMN